MSSSDTELPSNKKFGLFFVFIFLTASGYFHLKGALEPRAVCLGIAAGLLCITLIKEQLLLPLNKLWLRFGVIIGMIISPIVLGLIFFLLITPMALLMKLFRRDELRLRMEEKQSHWIKRGESVTPESFKYQF